MNVHQFGHVLDTRNLALFFFGSERASGWLVRTAIGPRPSQRSSATLSRQRRRCMLGNRLRFCWRQAFFDLPGGKGVRWRNPADSRQVQSRSPTRTA